MLLSFATWALVGAVLAMPRTYLGDAGTRRTTVPESVLNATSEELKFGAAKITYLGEQSKTIGTVIFHSQAHSFSTADFEQIHGKRELYSNDRSPYTSYFAVEPDEFRRMLRAVKAVLSKSKAAEAGEFLSFSVIRREGSLIVGDEFHIGAQLAREFYAALIGSLNENNSSGNRILQKQFRAVCP